MRQLVLPSVIFIFALISLSTLMSIAPDQAMRQMMFFILGFVIFFTASKIPFSAYLRLSPVLYVGLNVTLLLTLLFAVTTRNTARWITIGDSIVIQPSQLAIPITALFILNFLQKKKLSDLKNFALTLLFMAIPALLILVQPDLDTTIVFLLSTGSILWFGKTQSKHLAVLALAGVIMAAGAWFFVLKDYQKARFTSFFAGAASSQDAHYNAQQAMIAIGSGQIVGKGLGQGVQSHLRFLPERQTDFIFAAIAEEYGLIGSLTVVSLYMVIGSFCLYIGYTNTVEREKIFCYVVSSALFFQAGVNISMNLGLIPIAGLTLPLISAGGSSVLAVCGMLGIMQTLAKKPKQKLTLHLA